jgi:hypothetical protein
MILLREFVPYPANFCASVSREALARAMALNSRLRSAKTE